MDNRQGTHTVIGANGGIGLSLLVGAALSGRAPF
jgi:hypothetical protein